MTWYSGTGKSGRTYNYHICKNAKKHLCEKKVVDKDKIENKVVEECRRLLTDSSIACIAEAIDAVCKAEYDSSTIKRIRAAIKSTDDAIENLWKALEAGQSVEMITECINKRQKERDKLVAQLAVEKKKQVILTGQEVRHFLHRLKSGAASSANNRALVNIFVRAIYLYDDKFTLVLNSSGQPITIDDALVDEIDSFFEKSDKCSSVVSPAPGPRHSLIVCSAIALDYSPLIDNRLTTRPNLLQMKTNSLLDMSNEQDEIAGSVNLETKI